MVFLKMFHFDIFNDYFLLILSVQSITLAIQMNN